MKKFNWEKHYSGRYLVADIRCERVPKSKRFSAYKDLKTGEIEIVCGNCHFAYAKMVGGKLETTNHTDTFVPA